MTRWHLTNLGFGAASCVLGACQTSPAPAKSEPLPSYRGQWQVVADLHHCALPVVRERDADRLSCISRIIAYRCYASGRGDIRFVNSYWGDCPGTLIEVIEVRDGTATYIRDDRMDPHAAKPAYQRRDAIRLRIGRIQSDDTWTDVDVSLAMEHAGIAFPNQLLLRCEFDDASHVDF